MKLPDILEPGQQIRIESEQLRESRFACVLEINRNIVVELTPGDKESAPPDKGTELVIIATNDKGMFKIKARVIKNRGKNQNTLILAPLERDIPVIQRRSHFRLEHPQIRSHCRIIKESKDLLTKDWLEVEISDLSGGGTRLKIDLQYPLPPNTQIMLRMTMPESVEVISVVGKVIRCVKIPDKTDRYEICLSFTIIDEKDRDRIVGWLFQQQLEKAGRP